MTQLILLITTAVLLLCTTINHCQALNDTDTSDNRTEIVASETRKPFVYHGRYHGRFRRQYQDSPEMDTAETILAILPFDKIGSIIGQIMATGMRDMFNPNVGNKIVDVLQTQAPTLLTSLFANLYTNLRAPSSPAKTPSTSIANSPINNGYQQQLSNSSILLPKTKT